MSLLEKMRSSSDSSFMQLVFIAIVIAFIFAYGQTSGDTVGTVATVNGTPIRTTDWQREYRLAERGASGSLDDSARDMLGERVKEQMIRKEVALQEAEALGLQVSKAELAAWVLDQEYFKEEGRFNEKRYQAKRMAVYAGMVEAMDFHMGRLIEYLKAIGEYENTIFIFTSDNGSAASGPANPRTFFTRIGVRPRGYSTDYETLGLEGSFNSIGPSFASASVSPLAYYKLYAGEGGLRVPLIISGQALNTARAASNAFAWVTDIAPTVLELTSSRTIQLNGTIPMVMALETTEIGLLAMEHNGLTQTTTDMETIRTEPTAISISTTHSVGPIQVEMDIRIKKTMTPSSMMQPNGTIRMVTDTVLRSLRGCRLAWSFRAM